MVRYGDVKFRFVACCGGKVWSRAVVSCFVQSGGGSGIVVLRSVLVRCCGVTCCDVAVTFGAVWCDQVTLWCGGVG
jgi:hypothetical protein